ncbi:MAG: MFS transporter [Rhizobacter sp.]|nr:MFS transporter [Ferruginibacter sp.]
MQKPGASSSDYYNIILFACCMLSGIFSGLTSTLVPSYLPVIAGSFDDANGDGISALINAVFIYGMLAGGLLLGFLGDKKGRRSGFILSTLLTGIFTLLVYFTNGWPWLVCCRFLTGMGVGGVLLTGTILIAEAWSEQKKGIALGILSISFPIGIFSAGLITSFVNDWRQAFLAGILPLALAAFSIVYIKETGSWLAEKKQKEISGNALKTNAVIKNIITGSLLYGTMLIGLWAVFAWLPTWVQGLVKNSDGQSERGISMMLFAFGGLAGGFFSGWLTRQFGMKNMMLLCFSGAFILSIVLFRLTTVLTVYTYINMGIIALFFGISQGVLNIFIPALFPTGVRSTATGICFNISRIFTATAVFFIGWLVDSLNGFGNALFIFSFVFLAGLLVTLFMHKNTGYVMEK